MSSSSVLSACVIGVLPSLFGQTTPSGPPIFLTTASEVHNLPAELAPRARVHITGTITYYDPLDSVMFVQDKSGGVFVGTNSVFPVRDGDYVDIQGEALAGYRTEVAPDPVIRVLGRASQPKAHPTKYSVLSTGIEDSQLVVVRGQVRNANLEQHENATYVHLDVGVEGEEVEVYLGSAVGVDPDSLVGASVEITAVAGGVFDAKSQLTGIVLYAPNASAIRVLDAPKAHVKELPLTDIDKVFEEQRIDDRSKQVRVRGSVTYYRKGVAVVLQQGSKSIYAQTRETKDIAIGDVVDAFGMPSNREYAPSLSQATLKPLGRREVITPRAVSYEEALSGLYSDTLISLSGVLVSQLQDSNNSTLVLNINGHLVSGSLEGSATLLGMAKSNAPSQLQQFELGSHIRISGVCRIVPAGPWRAPALFHVDMRSADDAQLVSKPSWFTVRHLAELLGVLLLLATGASVWAVLLRKRVGRQSERIERSMLISSERSRILERVSSDHSLESILSDICDSITKLMPGFTCVYEMNADIRSLPEEQIGHPDGNIYFEMPLTDDTGTSIGRMFIVGPGKGVLDADQQEVAALTELAILAVERYQLHQQLVHRSTHDHLTKLPNRRFCEAGLQSAIDKASSEGSELAVIYIDVNRFKFVNDSFGHKTGDLYLQEISDRLRKEMRAGDIFARIGGDEFLFVSPLKTSSITAEALLHQLQTCFDVPFILEANTIQGSASFGLATYPQDGLTAEELKRKADHAMYIAKRGAAQQQGDPEDFCVVSPEELELALKSERFRLAYQPQFSAQGRLTGLEALIRLHDPILGLLTPDAFISVAERHEVIIGIGLWVIRQALRDAIRWQLDSGEMLRIAVNVSVRQLEQQNFAETIFAVLEELNFPAERLELEITERILISDCEGVVRQLEQLREGGVCISLDDFGTGQSSLSLLHQLPIDTIKLDRSFIRAVDVDPRVWPIIKAICFMADGLGKRVVAEGIEHVGPVPELLAITPMDFQGYLLSRPIPSDQLEKYLPHWRLGIAMPDEFKIPSLMRAVVPTDKTLKEEQAAD